MSAPTVRAWLVAAATDTLDAATGHEHHPDPVLPRSGGPAGNAQLTAWTGLLLLVLFGAELVTLLDVRGLISWHIVLGTLLIPPALLKTVSTGWRVVRYYTGEPSYHQAGPPPMLLRLLGPLVVGFTLALLGSGVALILLGENSGRTVRLQALGQRVDAVTIHQALFVVWEVVTGVHVLARLYPAMLKTVVRPQTGVPGRPWRGISLLSAVLVAGLVAWLVLGAAGDWRSDSGRGDRPPPGSSAPGTDPRWSALISWSYR